MEFVPRIAKAPAAAAVIGGLMAVQVGDDMLKGRNKSKVGRVSYADGPARMTNSFTSGAVPAMIQGSGGDYEVFEDMAEETLQSDNVFGKVFDDYGANSEMIRSLYNMR